MAVVIIKHVSGIVCVLGHLVPPYSQRDEGDRNNRHYRADGGYKSLWLNL